MKKLAILSLIFMFFVGCVPTKQLLKEQLSQQTKTTTNYKEQLSQSENHSSKLQIERDSLSKSVFFWQSNFETERSERTKLQQQFEANKWKIEYYESGQVKSEEKSSASKNTEFSSEKYERIVAELQSKLEQEVKYKERLLADSVANSQILLDRDIRITELTDTNTKIQSKATKGDFLFGFGVGVFIAVFGFVVWRLSKFLKKI